jgi:CheY-like chemotaxis protein
VKTNLSTALVVDDDADLRWVTRRVLERAGYRVLEASDGLEALALLEVTTPTLMVLDLVMPRLMGDELLEEACLRGLLDGVSVLLLSGSAHVRLPCPCERQQKPMSPESLLSFAHRARRGETPTVPPRN